MDWLCPIALTLAWVGGCDCGDGAAGEVSRPQEPSVEAPAQEAEVDAALHFIDPPAAEGAFAPSLRIDGRSVWSTWIEPIGADGHRVRVARLSDHGWSDPVTLARSDRMFANWADFPSVVRAGDGSVVAHWLEKSGEETYAYDVVLMRSVDEGEQWTRLGAAHDDGTPTEHGFVSYAPTDDGVRIFWLDGRHTQPDADGERGAMTLRTGVLSSGELGPSEVIDARVCDCCRTVAAATGGGVLVAYRDRSEEEIRDTAVVRSVAGEWTEPEIVQADGWEFRGCPVNGPALDGIGDRLALAWFTGEGDRAGVWAAFSDDGGETFGEPVRVAGGGTLGRVGVALGDGAATVSWVEPAGEGDGSTLWLRRVGEDGRVGRAVRVATLPEGRSSGFPQMVRYGDHLLLAWTEGMEGRPDILRLRAARVELPEAAQR